MKELKRTCVRVVDVEEQLGKLYFLYVGLAVFSVKSPRRGIPNVQLQIQYY